MRESAYSIEDYATDIRRIADEEREDLRIAERIQPLAVKLASSRGWMKDEYRRCDPSQGFGVHLLHEEPDHALAVFAICWLPGHGTLPHNHRTWAVVVGLEGRERETLWRRLDDGFSPGYAELECVGERVVETGDVSVCMPEDIHAVRNIGTTPSMSLHTYGRHINFTGRSEFDPTRHEERPMIVSVERQSSSSS